MAIKPNYFKLGLFILIALFLLVVGIILFGSGAFAKKNIFFESYFADPVTGLAVGSPVLEQGVQVGVVEEISFVRHEPDYCSSSPEVTLSSSPYHHWVRVVCSVEAGRIPEIEGNKKVGQRRLDALIKNGLRLQLSKNILTGQGYIEARYLDPERFPVEEFIWAPQYLFIPSAPSDFTTMKDSVDKILQRLEQIETEKIADNVNKVLVTVNEAVNSAKVEAISEQAKAFISELRQTNEDLKALLGSPTLETDLANIAEFVDQMNLAMSRVDQLVLTQTPQVIETMRNLKQMSENLKNITKKLEETPSDLIFSRPPEKKEILK